jgi:hypothetical protein
MSWSCPHAAGLVVRQKIYCDEAPGKKIVEDTWIYPVYQTFFIFFYFIVSGVCGRIVVEHWIETKKVSLRANRCELCAYCHCRVFACVCTPPRGCWDSLAALAW